MAIIAGLTENAEGGANGAVVTTANTIFDNVLAINPPVFSTAQAVEGAGSIAFLTTAASIVEANLTGIDDLHLSYYLYVTANSASNTAFFNAWGDGNTVKIMDLRFLADGTVPQLRSVNSAVWSGTALALNSWHRFDIRISPANDVLRVRVFSGANRHGTVPDQDSADQTLTAAVTTVDNVRFGQISADATLGFHIDRIRGDDAAYPAPVAAATAPPANTAAPTVGGDGSPIVGETLTSTLGTWTGTPTPTLARQWKRDGANISGATGSTHTPSTAGSYRCDVTGTNTDPGSPVTAQSNAITVAAAPAALAGAAATQADTATLKVTNPTNGTGPYTHAIAQLSGPATTARLVTGQAGWWAVERQASATTWRVTTTDAAGSTALVRDVTVQPAGAATATTGYYGTSTGWVAV